MKQEKKELTEEEKFEQELQLESDLAKYARDYTILDRNRTQFSTGGGGGMVAKQARVISIYKKEQRDILKDLHVASADARKVEDAKKSKQLKELLQEYDQFDGEIKLQKTHLNEMDGQIKMVKKKVLDLASQQITDEKFQERHIKGEKTLETLENKLEVQVKKFCEICAENVRLREEINHLLNERNKFNRIWDKLINNLCMGKKFMLDLIEQATIAYDQREEWVSKLQFLRTKAHNELVAHIHEMRILQRKMDHDEKLQEFFAVKGQKRIMQDLEKKEIEKRRKNKENLEKNLSRYMQMLVAIMEFTGEEHVQNIAKDFLAREESNFSMFKYINHMNREMEELSDSLGRLHAKIDDIKLLNEFRRESQESKLFTLRQKSEDLNTETKLKEDELARVNGDLEIIKKGVGEMFKMFKCSNDPLMKLLGQNDTINNFNVMLYLEILEQNIQEYLVSVFYYEKRQVQSRKMRKIQMLISDTQSPVVIEPLESFVKSSPCPLCVEHEHVNDVIDELQFAMTKDEVQVKLKQIDEAKGLDAKVHNVSACHLPKSRQIIQKRYQ